MRPTLTFLALALPILLLSTACSRDTSEPVSQAAQQEQQSPPPASRGETARQEVDHTLEKVKSEAEAGARAIEKGAKKAADTAGSVVEETIDMVKQQPPAVQEQAGRKMPQTVTYDASMGQVTFNHARHAQQLPCLECHTTDPPRKIAVNREVAHALSKGCHQARGGKAPTSCHGCHRK